MYFLKMYHFKKVSLWLPFMYTLAILMILTKAVVEFTIIVWSMSSNKQ